MPALTQQTAAPFIPEVHSLPVLQKAVQSCHGCDLYRNAIQAVFGELEAAPARTERVQADLMMIGEQPGDHEDKEGHPFVGPAGKLLDQCLEEAGIDRHKVYVTNTVKHFKWEPRGKIRLHKKPNMQEIRACRPWLDAELEAVQPRLIVCLGATAAQGLLGARFRITQSHGQVEKPEGLPPVIATLHPSAILRARTSEDRERDRGTFIDDLRKAAAYVKTSGKK